ncbi:MAG: pyridoxamine 5'-phosphate oxidase family protein [Clostridia bacterium]|nr:pyridoxamine 5'-phosphate oxidase family protein [Clostridia bacterium]
MKRVYEFLKQSGCYYLATVDEGKPRVRPFGTVNLFENRIYIQTGKVKEVAKQLKENSRVELSAMNKDGKWIRVSADAVLDENLKAQESMLNEYPSLKSIYAVGDGNTEVYYLKNGKAQICSFTEEPLIIEF